ncbi:hypothetical protein SRABI84_03927 [Peribacillus simplex]|nr:hypothetical protein SRABI84_03927 [Peribacillus simplex]
MKLTSRLASWRVFLFFYIFDPASSKVYKQLGLLGEDAKIGSISGWSKSAE